MQIFVNLIRTLPQAFINVLDAKPRVLLTASNRNHFEQVSLTVLDNFFDAIAKAKKLIHKSVAQHLKQVSPTKNFLALAMVFNLLLSNPSQPNLTAIDKAKKTLCQ